MKDYYKILGVRPDSDRREIRRAYRKRAKDVHPDLAAGSRQPEADFILLREAYDVLSTPDIRAEYDLMYSKLYRKKDSFKYRDFLLEHIDDLSCRIKLICYDLLHKEEEEALARFAELGKRPIHIFADHLDREDFMDFGYIIADELFIKRKYTESFSMFYEIALLEEDKPYFKHFYPELLGRLREITRRRIKAGNPDVLRIQWLEKMLDLQYPLSEIALIHKQIAEIFLGHGEKNAAAEHFAMALSINPRLPGKSKLAAGIGRGTAGSGVL